MFRGIASSTLAIKPSAVQSRGLASQLLSKTEKDWLSKTAQELRTAAKARGISGRGTKAEIARRLLDAERDALSPNFSPSGPVREFTSSARYNVEPNPAQSKFTPRRPYLLNVKLPEEPDEVEEGPIIPYLPDTFGSHHTQSASPIQETPSAVPRVITVASAATHPDGGPSHNLWGGPTDPHLHEVLEDHADVLTAQQTSSLEVKKKGEQGIVGDLLEDLGLAGVKFQLPIATSGPSKGAVKSAVKEVRSAVSTIISASKSQPEESSETPSGDLNAEEKRGLYALAGLLGTGYVFSKLFS